MEQAGTEVGMSAEERQEIRITMEEAQAAVANKALAIKLVKSDAFEKIIGKMYYEDESMRLVGLKGELSLTEVQQGNVDKMMYGVAFLQRFIGSIIQLGSQMEQELKDAQVELNRSDDDQEIN